MCRCRSSGPHPGRTLFALFLIQTVSCCLRQVGLQRVILQVQPLQVLDPKPNQPQVYANVTTGCMCGETHPELREADRQQSQLVVVQVQMLEAGQVSQLVWQTAELILTQIHLDQVSQVAKLWLWETKEKYQE